MDSPEIQVNPVQRAISTSHERWLALWRGMVYFDLAADLDAHQVLADFQWSGISFSGVRDDVGDFGWDDV